MGPGVRESAETPGEIASNDVGHSSNVDSSAEEVMLHGYMVQSASEFHYRW